MPGTDMKPCEIPHILIVDDDPDLLESLKETLEICDDSYYIHAAKDINEALRISKDFSPDLALIDIKVGQEDGLELIPQLKQDTDIICIMMTAFREAEYAVEAVKKGADDYLFKPINPEHLFATLQKHLINQQRQRNDSLSQNRVKQVFEKVDHLLFVVDIDGNTLEANETALKMPRACEECVLGEKFWLLPWWSEDKNNSLLIQEKLQEAITGKTVSFEITDSNCMDNTHHYAVTMKPVLDANGQVSMIIPEVRDITEQKNSQIEIETLAFYDPLTGLANRRMFTTTFEKALLNCQRHAMQSALLFIDLDHFKEVNDQLGHLEGDRLLKQVAKRLLASLRQEDSAARLGGDEFVVLLSMIDGDPQSAALKAEVVAEKVRQALCMPYQLPEHIPQVSASIGIVLFPYTGSTLQELVNAADTAMYKAKQEGRNQVALYDIRFEEAQHGHRLSEEDILKGIEQAQFQLYFQPIYNQQGAIEVLEVFPRWHHPEYGLIMAAEFIPLAEQYEMITALCHWTLRKACEELAQHPELGCKLSINVSPQNFYHEQFVEQLLVICRETQIATHRIVIELRESLIEHNPQEVAERIEQLAAHGVQFALDDFTATGNSLHHLSMLPIKQVKLTPNLIKLSQQQLGQARLIQAVVAMAAALQVTVIAKNIESEAQYIQLSELGCGGFQGYYLKKPMPITELLQS